MGLTAAEKKALERLQRKAEEPDAPPVSRSITATVDLSDPKSIAAAIKHGFLTSDEVEDLQDDEGDGESDEGDETPKRRGYFKDS